MIKEHPIPFKVMETKLDEHSSFYLFGWNHRSSRWSKESNVGKKRLLRQIQSSSTAEAIEGIMADLASYQSHHKRRDDLTLFGFLLRKEKIVINFVQLMNSKFKIYSLKSTQFRIFIILNMTFT